MMKISVICEVETKTGYKEITFKAAKKLLDSGVYYSDPITIGLEHMEAGEILRFSLLKGDDDEW
jgi:hypothetical protein